MFLKFYFYFDALLFNWVCVAGSDEANPDQDAYRGWPEDQVWPHRNLGH
jgi:hypothetical protein